MSMDKFKDLIVYFNGGFVSWDQANVHVFSPAVKYGASVFEGIRGYWNSDKEKLFLFRLDDHMRRIEFSQRVMRFGEIAPAGPLCDATVELMRRNDFRASVHIRPTIYLDEYGESSARGPIGQFITAIPRGTPEKV